MSEELQIPEAPQTTPDTLAAMSEEERTKALGHIAARIMRGFAQENYVRIIQAVDDDAAIIRDWLTEIDLPPVAKQLITVVDAPEGSPPGIIPQSQIEAEWLQGHFREVGILEYLQAKGAPIILTYADMKMLFLLNGVRECEARRGSRILRPT